MFNIGKILKVDIAISVITQNIKKVYQAWSRVELVLKLLWNLPSVQQDTKNFQNNSNTLVREDTPDIKKDPQIISQKYRGFGIFTSQKLKTQWKVTSRASMTGLSFILG